MTMATPMTRSQNLDLRHRRRLDTMLVRTANGRASKKSTTTTTFIPESYTDLGGLVELVSAALAQLAGLRAG
jgi:hypothetical protein